MARVEAVNHVGWAVQVYKEQHGWITFITFPEKARSDKYCLNMSSIWPHREFRVYEEVSDAKL